MFPNTLLKVSLVSKVGTEIFFCEGSELINPANNRIAVMIPTSQRTSTLSNFNRWYNAVIIILAIVAIDVAIITEQIRWWGWCFHRRPGRR